MKDLQITPGVITPRDVSSINILLNDVNKYKTFTIDEEIKIFKEYAINKDQKLFNEIINRNIRFVISIAKKYQRKSIPLEDLISSGCVGLVRAVDVFDINKGFKFISFAVFYIRAEIISSIINHDRLIRLPQTISNAARLVEKNNNETTQLTDKESNAINCINSTRTVSLDSMITEDFSLMDVISNDNADDPLSHVKKDDRIKFINTLLKYLNPRELYIINHTYQLNGFGYKKSADLAEELKISVTRVDEIKRTSLKRLKWKIGKNKFKLSQNLILGQ